MPTELLFFAAGLLALIALCIAVFCSNERRIRQKAEDLQHRHGQPGNRSLAYINETAARSLADSHARRARKD